MGTAEPPGWSDAVESVDFLGPSGAPAVAACSPLRRTGGRRLTECSCPPPHGSVWLCSGTVSSSMCRGGGSCPVAPVLARG